jgi:hypothetical protein
MVDLDFYIVDDKYIKYLQDAEKNKRDFFRVPNVDYGIVRKPKFLCGVVLEINEVNYLVPVSSNKKQFSDNFLINDKNGIPTSSLRFNYMIPVPLSVIERRKINIERDYRYRELLRQELLHCVKYQDRIRHLAKRTYKNVLRGDNKGLVYNSCDFELLEEKCRQWTKKEGNEKG